MTTSDNIAAIEKALEGVTPGPWYPGHLGTDSTCQCQSIVDDGGYMGAIATVHVDNGLAVGDGGNDAPPALRSSGSTEVGSATSSFGRDRNSDINELAGEASAYTSEVHRAAAQAVSRARLDKSHQTTPSELCVVPAVTSGPANHLHREIERLVNNASGKGLKSVAVETLRAALKSKGSDHG